jgi:transcription elongation factor GreB
MNKAFTKETETEEALPEFVDALPPGMKNYMTPEGAARLKDELSQLRDVERPKLIKAKEDAPAKKRLREVDQRIQFILQRLQIIEVVDPSRQKNQDEVFFGATVTYVDGAGAEHTVRIVGVDEARTEAGEVSWVAPIAQALNGAGEGDMVKLFSPSGIEELEILKIEYL